ncbi:transmembrane protein 14C-like protein [Willisornis vidua]|uniref:Transmembrane protein 14C-like protein n=1 Tax=Willisornis vidua TaxID=1566151 RepID=A0ABQ9DA98_9PASS|nr:transmembrane protein 14C-like protein [Willisornis vidua]
MEYDWLGFGYAALVAAGGVVGYAKAVASGTLSAVMGMRFYNSKKAMPGIIAGARTDIESPCYAFQYGICLNIFYTVKQENMTIALV